MAGNYIVQTNKLTKEYKNLKALDHVDIKIERGSIYGLVGNNGAGKTTLLKILTGQTIKTNGSFTLMGADSEKGYSQARRRIGAIIENPGFYPKLTVGQNMEYYRIQRGIPGKKTVNEILDFVGIGSAHKKKFENLSLGMKQRLGIALAMMGEPDLLILDEPINGLDPAGIVEIRNMLLKLNKEKGVTIIISSHILTELSNIATDYGFLNHGMLAEQISAEALRDKCQTYLQIKVSDAPAYAAYLEKEEKSRNYKIMPDETICIYDNINDIEEYGSLAMRYGIGVRGLEMKEINLENYYINLIDGNRSKKEVAVC